MTRAPPPDIRRLCARLPEPLCTHRGARQASKRSPRSRPWPAAWRGDGRRALHLRPTTHAPGKGGRGGRRPSDRRTTRPSRPTMRSASWVAEDDAAEEMIIVSTRPPTRPDAATSASARSRHPLATNSCCCTRSARPCINQIVATTSAPTHDCASARPRRRRNASHKSTRDSTSSA